MSVPVAYIAIILIWSTTPLGIKWSADDIGYELGLAARMLIGMTLLWLIIMVRRTAFPWDKTAMVIYLVSGLSSFLTMVPVYWSAQYIPSGWIAVIFGTTPILTGVFAVLLIKEKSFSEGRLIGMLIGLAGLWVIFAEGRSVSQATLFGLAGVLVATIAQVLGAVMLKKLQPTIPAISITVGSLVIATPLFFLYWWLFGPPLPETVSDRTIWSVIYLAVLGTGIGFPLYYYVLKRLTAGHVSLINLITPVTALLVGAWLNQEFISNQVWAGTGLIIFGLFIHELKKLSRIWAGPPENN